MDAFQRSVTVAHVKWLFFLGVAGSSLKGRAQRDGGNGEHLVLSDLGCAFHITHCCALTASIQPFSFRTGSSIRMSNRAGGRPPQTPQCQTPQYPLPPPLSKKGKKVNPLKTHHRFLNTPPYHFHLRQRHTNTHPHTHKLSLSPPTLCSSSPSVDQVPLKDR